MGRSTNLDLDH